MKKIKILTVGAFVLAIGGAFTVDSFGSPLVGEVDFDPAGASPCEQQPTCKTTNTGLNCTVTTYRQGTNCQIIEASKLP